MNRRHFLQLASAGAAIGSLNGFSMNSIAASPLLQLLGRQSATNGRVLVLIQLVGGNDGLNTIIPLDQYSQLHAARANILIPEQKVLRLSGVSDAGFHPALAGLRSMYDEGLMNIVQGVGYPNESYSHFRATDIWLTGSDATQYLNDGWLGRYLSNGHTDYADNPYITSPLAIEVGNSVSTVLLGPRFNTGMAVNDVDSFYSMLNNSVDTVPATAAGHELKFLRQVAQQIQRFTGALQAAASKAKNLYDKYPPNNSLAEQLKIVARLIAGGLETPVYVVNITGFDFHAGQVAGTDTTTGGHSLLLTKVSEAVSAFFKDCKLLQTDERIAAMAFSEFGRRIVSNGALGTDHGAAAPVMVFGNKVNPGFIGANAAIPPQATVRDNIAMQHDYRSVYAAILADWFEVETTVMADLLMREYPVLPIFKAGINEHAKSANSELMSRNYPNPFSDHTTFTFNSIGGHVTILLLDGAGRSVRTLVNDTYPSGEYRVTINRDALPAGHYFYKLVAGKVSSTMRMQII